MDAKVARAQQLRAFLRAGPFLYPLTDRAQGGESLPALAEGLLLGGARVLQVRDRGRTDLQLLRDLRAVMELARRHHGFVIVNDRVDLALAAGADGVHVGDEDLPVEDARRLCGDGMIVGVSTHGEEEAVAAARLPVDYVALGPVFRSPTKQAREPLGLAVLRRVRARIELPLVAIGGIGAEALEEVALAGANGLAVISAVMTPGRVAESTRSLVRRLAALPGARDGR